MTEIKDSENVWIFKGKDYEQGIAVTIKCINECNQCEGTVEFHIRNGENIPFCDYHWYIAQSFIASSYVGE